MASYNKMLFKTVICPTKELKNKTISALNNIAYVTLWSLVINVFLKKFAWEDQSKNQCYIRHVAPETCLEYYVYCNIAQ